MSEGTHELFVSCGEGLEELLVEELQELGYSELRKGFRGVYVVNASFRAIYHLNYCSRIASRVLLPLKKFRCYNARSLYQELLAIDWSSYLSLNQTFAIDSNVTHHQLRNSLFAAQVAKDAICDQFRERTGSRPSVDVAKPDVQINLFIREPFGVIGIDTSGTPLHKRGYRLESIEAPIQKTLAAAILRIAKYRGEDFLCDPCCGSGT